VAAVRMSAFRLRAAESSLLALRWSAHVDRLAGRLEDLNPDRVLARGYSRTVLARTGQLLTRAADAAPGDLLRTHLAEGELESRVTEAHDSGLSESKGMPARKPFKKRHKSTDDGPQKTLFD
jgi:exonuclease VII large subunit